MECLVQAGVEPVSDNEVTERVPLSSIIVTITPQVFLDLLG